jgi:hypothetical protein
MVALVAIVALAIVTGGRRTPLLVPRTVAR